VPGASPRSEGSVEKAEAAAGRDGDRAALALHSATDDALNDRKVVIARGMIRLLRSVTRREIRLAA
jgi:hypothetical protein